MSDIVWFLDVDGPLNASKAGWDRAPTRRHVRTADGISYRLTWEPKLVRTIGAMHTNGVVEVRWCTTWCPETHLLENLWGLPSLPRCWDEYPEGNYVGDLKLNSVLAALESGRRVIWTDDTETPTPEINGDLYRKLVSMGDILLIRPNSTRGLRPTDMDQITMFCASQ